MYHRAYSFPIRYVQSSDGELLSEYSYANRYLIIITYLRTGVCAIISVYVINAIVFRII